MNTRMLRAFKLVYELGSIAQAAERLYISPQGLSKTISALETELGHTLFTRTSRGVVPTSAANVLYPRTVELIGLIDSVMDDMTVAERRTLRVAVSSGYFMRFGSEFLAGFTAEHPSVTLDVREHYDEEVLAEVESGRADCGFTPACADASLFEATNLTSHPFLLLTSHEHRLAAHDVIDYPDLNGEVLVALGNGHVPYGIVKAHLDAAGVRPASLSSIIEITTGINLAQRGEALCFITDFAVSSFVPSDVIAKPMADPGLTWDYRFVRRRGAMPDELVDALRDYVATWLADHRDVVFH